MPDSPPEMCTETTSPAVGQQRLEDGAEVPDRGLRGGGQRLGAAQLLEEGRVIGDLDLRHRAIAPEDHVEGDDVYPVPLDQLRRQVGGAVGHDRDVRHARASLLSRRRTLARGLGKVLVTGATGFIGSHVARLCAERGDDVRLAVEEGSPDAAIADLDELQRVRCEVRDRRSVRRALKGVERVFHCAGVTSVRPADSERVFDVNVGGTKIVMEECLRARGGAGRLHLERRGGRPAPRRARRPTKASCSPPAGSASRTSTRCTRRRWRRCGWRRAGCRSCA